MLKTKIDSLNIVVILAPDGESFFAKEKYC